MMLQAGVAGATIATTLGIDKKTLYRACKRTNRVLFGAYAQQKRAVGLDLLRLKQHEIALKGNVAMLIWLGKNYLDQRDEPKQDGNDAYGKILEYMDELKKAKDAP